MEGQTPVVLCRTSTEARKEGELRVALRVVCVCGGGGGMCVCAGGVMCVCAGGCVCVCGGVCVYAQGGCVCAGGCVCVQGDVCVRGDVCAGGCVCVCGGMCVWLYLAITSTAPFPYPGVYYRCVRAHFKAT